MIRVRDLSFWLLGIVDVRQEGALPARRPNLYRNVNNTHFQNITDVL